jgi:hypothetical protein
MRTHLAVSACRHDLALIWVVDHAEEEGVGKQALPAPAGCEVPDDAGAVTAGTHTLVITADSNRQAYTRNRGRHSSRAGSISYWKHMGALQSASKPIIGFFLVLDRLG